MTKKISHEHPTYFINNLGLCPRILYCGLLVLTDAGDVLLLPCLGEVTSRREGFFSQSHLQRRSSRYMKTAGGISQRLRNCSTIILNSFLVNKHQVTKSNFCISCNNITFGFQKKIYIMFNIQTSFKIPLPFTYYNIR